MPSTRLRAILQGLVPALATLVLVSCASGSTPDVVTSKAS